MERLASGDRVAIWKVNVVCSPLAMYFPFYSNLYILIATNVLAMCQKC